MKKAVESRLSFPIGTRENPIAIDIDWDNHEHSQRQNFKPATKRQLGVKWKPSPVVLDLAVEKSENHQSFHQQLINPKAAAKKMSSSEMAESGAFSGPFQGGSAFPRVPRWRRPYAKRPLPRFPTARLVYEKNNEGRYFRKRAYGNYPHSVPDPTVQASWDAHVSKRVKRQAKGRINSGRETMRQEMNAEEDLSLSQGDVSKKGKAVPFMMLITKDT